MSSTTRHRAYAWEDQSPTITAGGTHDGLAILQAIGREELPLPPALRTLDITPVEAEPGRVSFTLVPSEFHLNPFGLVHGGVLAALIDTAMGCAVHSLLPVGGGYVTSELNVRYLRAAGLSPPGRSSAPARWSSPVGGAWSSRPGSPTTPGARSPSVAAPAW